MIEAEKQRLLDELQTKLARVRQRLEKALAREKMHRDAPMQAANAEEKMSHMFMRSVAARRVDELDVLLRSPFFMYCELRFEESGKKANLYLGKFIFIEEDIYSWVTPVATVRFESPGRVSFQTPKGETRHAIMQKKEQFIIVDGKVLFYAIEELGKARELIHQEHFTRKQGFVLPEIVAQMEKAQDQVIRAHHVGPFVIAGPAGSGKTTLALHRVAYLSQAPDTAQFYPGLRSIVFVQDTGTKQYFSHLLPELGIKDVEITTFSEWALKILDLRLTHKYILRYGATELEKDRYEYAKLQTLRSGSVPKFSKDTYALLDDVYAKYFHETERALWMQQQKEGLLDRFDLSILLLSVIKTYKKFQIEYDFLLSHYGGKLKRKKEKREIQYSLVVVDEFQNYLPEQLQILKRCVEPERQTTVYVGDMAQQVQLGTIQTWEEMGETITPERKVMLEKVYRNTKKILQYIGSLGYTVQIPEQLREGDPVQEKICASVREEISYIKELLKEKTEGLIGVLAKDKVYLKEFEEAFAGNEHVHVLTMAEAQGVEFETVCLVGVHKDLFSVAYAQQLPEVFRKTKQRIYKDLLYVALTRAMNELHVLGECRLSEVLTTNSGDRGQSSDTFCS